jgi:OFA family oxalate/formate antiporter-like MFS transporter
MTSERVLNRWLVVAGGILIQMCLGAIYAWSAFTAKLTTAPFDFTRTQTQVIFSIGLLSFAVVMALVAGRWQARSSPRVVAATGGMVLGLGYVLAGLSGTSFTGMLLGIGVLGGAGIGLAYVCPIAALVKWFPDKKGMITGLAVAGFGFGALVWIKLTGGFKFGPLDLTPGWDGLFGSGWTVNDVFVLYGVLFAGLVGLGSLVMVNPPEGWQPAGWKPPQASASSGGVEFTTSQMIRTPQYWGLFSVFAVGALSGLMVIGIIRLFGIDALGAAGMEVGQATVVTGTAMGLFYALFNGLGRIVWGTISDRLGRRRSIVVMSASQGVMMIAFYFIGGTEWGLYLGAAFIGFNFGGNFALFPAATADIFGNNSVGLNYPWVFLAYGVGGLLGPVLGGYMGDTGAWGYAFVPAGIACLAAAGVAVTLKPPVKEAVISGRRQEILPREIEDLLNAQPLPESAPLAEEDAELTGAAS